MVLGALSCSEERRKSISERIKALKSRLALVLLIAWHNHFHVRNETSMVGPEYRAGQWKMSAAAVGCLGQHYGAVY